MKLPSLHLLFWSSSLLVLAACADQALVVVPPQSGSAPLAVDLGNASRIPRNAALAGEGEGYGTVQAGPTAPASVSGMSHQPSPATPATVRGMDDSTMDHGSMPALNHSPEGSAGRQ